jgi:adenine phosphoribosyltransferase
MQLLKDMIRTIPNYPKDGIMFRDITTMLAHPKAFMASVDALVQHHVGTDFDHVAGIEARGFILGGAVAHRLGSGFIPVRKKGKLPGDTIQQTYDLEYGTDTVEIHTGMLKAGDKIILVDDLLATGGTAEAAILLIEQTGAEVAACSFVVDLPELGGRARIEAMGKPVLSLVEFEGE